MDSHLSFSYWCYRCTKFVRNNLGFCPECESAFVEDIDTPSPQRDTNYSKHRPRKGESLLQRLNMAIVVREGDGGEEIVDRYIDYGSGLLPCSPSMFDRFKESEDDRLVTKFSHSNRRRNSHHCVLQWLSARKSCPVCRHEYPSPTDMDCGLTAPGAPRILLCEVKLKDSAVKKVFRNMFSFFRGNLSSSSSPRRGTRYWELVDSGGLHWHRLP